LSPSEIQSEPPQPPQLHPANDADSGPIAAGLRVIDMASIVAGPVVSRCLADWGAEVIKVEAPEGDLIRGMPPVGQDQKPLPRDVNATFEYYNLGKAGIQLDISKAGDRSILLEMLKDADVFITNVRVQALAKAGLLYSDLQERYPRLVYAHMTGWGSDGVDAERAGVDAGPCWTASGLAAGVSGPEVVGNYPVGFGDTIAGFSLLAGVLIAIVNRDGRTGRGQYVDASLFRAGLWCAASGIITADNVKGEHLEGETVTDYSIVPPVRGARDSRATAWWSAPFPCGASDFIWFDVLDDSHEADGRLRRSVARALKASGSAAELVELPDTSFRELVAAALGSQAGAAEAIAALEREGVSCAVRHVTFSEAGAALFDDAAGALGRLYRASGCVDELASTIGIRDFTGVPRMPIAFSSTASHGPRAAGFRKGEHNRAVLARGWSRHGQLGSGRAPEQEGHSPTQQGPGGPRSTAPLRGLTVVELSAALDLSASATCCQLAEHGATVLKMPVSGSTLPRRLAAHYDRLKRLVAAEADCASALDKLLAGADVLVTNLPTEELQARGVSVEALRARFPGLVLLVLSPWGSSSGSGEVKAAAVAAGTGPQCGALGALWAASGLAATMQGCIGAPPPTPMLQMPELCASVFGFAGVAAGLLSRQRSRCGAGGGGGGGSGGQVVDVSYLGVGLLMSAFVQVTNRHRETRCLAYDTWAPTVEELATQQVFTVAKSSDGQFFMMYDIRPSASLTVRRLAGIGILSFMATIANGVAGIVSDENRKKGVTGLVPMRKLIQPINKTYRQHLAQLTWSEISEGFTKFGVWHNRIAMPYQMVSYPTACGGPSAGVSRSSEDGVVVHSPVFLRAARPHAVVGRSSVPASRL